MSILHNSNAGWFISHAYLINSFYKECATSNGVNNFRIKEGIFQIHSPFKTASKSIKKRKRKLEIVENSDIIKDIGHVKNAYSDFKLEIQHLLSEPKEDFNKSALDLSSTIYAESGTASVTNLIGENKDDAKFLCINNSHFLFPINCRFYCKYVSELNVYLVDEKFDLILLDPPWWNKYIRRKKAKTDFGYQMMFNDDIKALSINNLLKDDGVVVVWCTNSEQHIKALTIDFFHKWGVKFAAKLYWVKITTSGDTICNFSDPPGKQPFEQIVIGVKHNSNKALLNLNGKLVVSVPSALHSHKPPLIKILEPYLPENPHCLELFARYLQPNWSSWGLEVLRFQHESLYEIIDT
ncbi:hypothetical protein FQR65_LT00654 [Abscondita terminalis]|nr:hypothetical protein FQR65_LT00654 [Abscondita terminalis]